MNDAFLYIFWFSFTLQASILPVPVRGGRNLQSAKFQQKLIIASDFLVHFMCVSGAENVIVSSSRSALTYTTVENPSEGEMWTGP